MTAALADPRAWLAGAALALAVLAVAALQPGATDAPRDAVVVGCTACHDALFQVVPVAPVPPAR